jgi:hypothetical protein
MGGGPRHREDVRKAPAADIIGAVRSAQLAAGSGGSLPNATEFCVRPHRVSFVLLGPNGFAPGASVRLEQRHEGLDVVLADGSAVLGRVADGRSAALIGCLQLGFELEGSVETIDVEAKSGEVLVSGVRAGPT